MKNEVQIVKVQPVHSDARGSIADLVNEKLNHVGLIVTTKGSVRGNHYHKLSTQYSYITSGVFEVRVAPVGAPAQVTKHLMTAGDLITLPPLTIHQFKALEEAVMIDMISESREGSQYEEDVYRLEFKNDAFVLPV